MTILFILTANLRKLRHLHGGDVCLTQEDLLNSFKSIQPSAMKEVSLEIPQVLLNKDKYHTFFFSEMCFAVSCEVHNV